MSTDEKEQLGRWVETWKHATIALDDIKRRELRTLDTPRAVHDLYGDGEIVRRFPSPQTSGLVEQQMWCSRLRERLGL